MLNLRWLGRHVASLSKSDLKRPLLIPQPPECWSLCGLITDDKYKIDVCKKEKGDYVLVYSSSKLESAANVPNLRPIVWEVGSTVNGIVP